MVPVLAAYRDAALRSPLSELQTRASLLATEKMEEILRDRVEPGRGYAWITTANYPAESPVAGFPGFTRSVAVANATVGGVAVRQVTVTVANAGIAPVTLDTWFTELAP